MRAQNAKDTHPPSARGGPALAFKHVGAQLISQAHLHHTKILYPSFFRTLRRSISIEGVVLRNIGALILTLGALLAFSPLHPGIVCPLRATTGIPCPSCGMTTSIKACFQLDFGTALAASPGGLIVVGAAAGLLAARPTVARIPVSLFFVTVGALWIWQLFRFSVV